MFLVCLSLNNSVFNLEFGVWLFKFWLCFDDKLRLWFLFGFFDFEVFLSNGVLLRFSLLFGNFLNVLIGKYFIYVVNVIIFIIF